MDRIAIAKLDPELSNGYEEVTTQTGQLQGESTGRILLSRRMLAVHERAPGYLTSADQMLAMIDREIDVLRDAVAKHPHIAEDLALVIGRYRLLAKRNGGNSRS